MRYFNPSSSELTGGDANRRSDDAQPVDSVPSVMDNDPNADEEVINQNANQQYPEPIQKEDNPDGEPIAQAEPAKLTPDNLAASIAYALDGSGPGLISEKPNVPGGHKVISEGITGAGPEDEEAALKDSI